MTVFAPCGARIGEKGGEIMGLSVAVIRLFRLSGENIQKNWMTMIPEAAVEDGHVLNHWNDESID